MPEFLIILGAFVVVAFSIEPIVKRRQIRVKVWQMTYNFTSRKYQQAMRAEVVHQELKILNWELRPGYEQRLRQEQP